MSESYSPDPGVEPVSGSLLSTVFLSERDLGLRIPINYVTSPGVSLQAACFPRLRYEDDNSGDCLSNLLAVGFRRFELDLYWNSGRNVWSFCPVAIPESIPNSTAPSNDASSATLTSASLTAASSGSMLEARQATGSESSSTSETSGSSSVLVGSELPGISGTLLNASPTSLGNASPTVVVLPDSSNDPLISIGPYVCTTTINLSTFTSQILSFIEQTENTLDATLLYVTLNIHAAASDKSPLSSPSAPTDLPGALDTLSSLFYGNLSNYIYTPNNLASDRANLNNSWYTVQTMYKPIQDYYTVRKNQYGVDTTEDGWPATSYVEFSKSKRLLLGWGRVDPQMDRYDFNADAGTIFPNGYIQDIQTDVVADSSGALTSGCFMQDNTDELSKINSSWAIDTFSYPTTLSANITPLLNFTTNSVECGISPFLNVTLLNATAHDNPIPYQNFTYSTVWSWAANEPRNYTSSSASTESLFRCATANIDLSGRWVVADCSQKYYAACRASGQPYNWTITTYPTSYSFAEDACPDNYRFSAPRTALENSYLSKALKDNHRDYDGHGAWVDFNSLDYKSCWVTGGPNATCPYSDSLRQQDDLHERIILVPAIAATIALIVTALTIFVKVVGGRRGRRRSRRRGGNGFVYEGVPS
ncbi:Maintenance of telomere capping protein [Lachnellula subtilissima]|uniref:Maintenance of telomere capping protein 6 n=1 Tax=Lachnellula subtilissima TaxID=602034 RepID=A0A8H8RTZ2_9HELO|nr:Maintenance of telomere capping protein [Lachnellula subtilissima]